MSVGLRRFFGLLLFSHRKFSSTYLFIAIYCQSVNGKFIAKLIKWKRSTYPVYIQLSRWVVFFCGGMMIGVGVGAQHHQMKFNKFEYTFCLNYNCVKVAHKPFTDIEKDRQPHHPENQLSAAAVIYSITLAWLCV